VSARETNGGIEGALPAGTDPPQPAGSPANRGASTQRQLPAAGEDSLDHRQGTGECRARPKVPIDFDSVPSLQDYLMRCGLLKRAPSGGSVCIPCPVHPDADGGLSLSISMVDGCFRCADCGASGRGVVALHRLATGMNYITAVRDLQERFHG